jgi:hypothetical protein
MVLVFCPTAEAHPLAGDQCQGPDPEPLAVLEVLPVDPANVLPDVALAAMLRNLAEHHTERAVAEAAERVAEMTFRSPN